MENNKRDCDYIAGRFKIRWVRYNSDAMSIYLVYRFVGKYCYLLGHLRNTIVDREVGRTGQATRKKKERKK